MQQQLTINTQIEVINLLTGETFLPNSQKGKRDGKVPLVGGEEGKEGRKDK